MKLIYNDWLKDGLTEYLMSQDGINNADIINEKDMDVIQVDTSLSSTIIVKYIDLYQENEFSTMFSFDKQTNTKKKEYTYIAEDMCCEYCHMNFIRYLFDNENIIAVDSNFSFEKPAFNIEYKICLKDNYSEEELLDYINKHI